MLIRFLEALDEGGRAPVADQPPEAGAEARAWLKERHARLVLELPGPPLPHDAEAAAWGACRLYDGCRFLTYHHEGAEAVRQAFAAPPPTPTPAAVFGVDLVLRHLPELWTLAGSLLDDDPLLDALKRLATTWPLSSVGMPILEGFDLAPILAHGGLRRLFADRALQRRDRARLDDPRVLAAAREAVGEHGREFGVSSLEFGVGRDDVGATIRDR